MPKVSTIIPCHNEGPLLREAVRSALAQSHPETEVIVVADGPQNGQTQAILDELEANRQVRVLAKPQGGVSSARNFGIEEADGEYLLFLDADDLIDPSFAARGVEIFESTPEALIVGGQVVMFGAISGPYGPPFRLNQFLHESLLPVGHMVHTADARRVGGFDESLRRYEDHDFFLRILGLAPDAHTAVVQLPETLYHYRKHSQSVTSERDDALDLACQATVLRNNAALIGRYAEDFVDYRHQKNGLLSHYRRRYGRIERRVARAGVVARRARGLVRRAGN